MATVGTYTNYYQDDQENYVQLVLQKHQGGA